MFEKVNTGGVSLSVFELVTAIWAAEGFNLRDDWFGGRGNAGRHARLTKRALLRDIQPTDFLQGVSLHHSSDRRSQDLAAGRTGKEVAAVTAKREHILELPLSAQGLRAGRAVPPQRGLPPPEVPAVPHPVDAAGGATGAARRAVAGIDLDVQQVPTWADGPSALEPTMVQAASFNPNRLDTLRSRTSAAYRGLYVLLQRAGACDFFWKARMVDLDLDDVKLDIHHIFPKKWCETQAIPP